MWFRLLVLEDSRVALPTNKDEQEEEVAVARVCLPEFHPLPAGVPPSCFQDRPVGWPLNCKSSSSFSSPQCWHLGRAVENVVFCCGCAWILHFPFACREGLWVCVLL